MALSNRSDGDDAPESGRVPDMKRADATLPLASLLSRLTKRWSKQDEFCVRMLQDRWAEVVPDRWARDVRPVRVDAEGRLVVSVPHSATVRMELMRGSPRGTALLEGAKEIAGIAFTGVVVEDFRRRTGKRGKG